MQDRTFCLYLVLVIMLSPPCFANSTTKQQMTELPLPADRWKYGKEMFQLLVSKKTHLLTLLLCYYRPVLLHEGVAEWPLLDLTFL